MKTPEEIKKGLECCNADTIMMGCKNCPYERCMGTSLMIEDALTYIRQLEAKIPQWISVKERRPGTNEFVLVVTNQGAYRTGSFRYVGSEGAVWFKCGKSCIPCKYWMPLPEPPKEEV